MNDFETFELHAVKEPDGAIRVQLDGEAEDLLAVIGQLMIETANRAGLNPEIVACLAIEYAQKEHPEYKNMWYAGAQSLREKYRKLRGWQS